MTYFKSIFLIALALSGCKPQEPMHPAPADTAKIDRLLRLTQQRLILAHDVARYKWNRKAAIADPNREKVLLYRVVEQAGEKHVDLALTRWFFEAQIEASKMLQQADFDDWNKRGQGAFAEVIDLKDLRVKIDELNGQIINAILEATPFLWESSNQEGITDGELVLAEASKRRVISERAEEILQGEGITDRVRAVAIKPLRGH